ncbi:MAG: DMT family transporter, partial [Akkermansia muciniphila]
MPSETLKGHIAMGAAAVIWGLMSPVSKLVMQQGEVSSASLATFRLLGAAILFWLASAFVPGEPIERKHRLPLFYASLFGIIFNQMAFTVGVGFTSPADAAIITTITPVLTMILAAFVLREMITGKKIIGVCASAIGAILLVSGSGGRAAALPGDNNLLGDILCLASQCSVAVYFVFFKNLIGRYSPITLLKWMFTYAAAACLPFTFREVGSIHYSALPAQTWLGIA